MKPKKKNKKIKAFDNWLLARDGASRISTFPNYFATLENSNPDPNFYKLVMNKFDEIADTGYFAKFNRYFNHGMTKNPRSGYILIDIDKKHLRYEIINFIECLAPSKFEYIKRIEISTDSQKKDISIEIITDDSKRVLKAGFPFDIKDNDLIEFTKNVLETWLDNIDLGEAYKNNFFRWWMKKSILGSPKYYELFPGEFQSALVEWMKVCPSEEANQAYVDLIYNSKDKNIKRRNTEIGTKEIIDSVNQGIKEFNIDLSATQKGSGLLSRFDN